MTDTTITELPITLSASSSALEVRLAARQGGFSGHTSGVASAHVQVNLAILPAALAEDFKRFCALNPTPCPLLAVSEPGSPALPALGLDLDIRTDVPRYHVWQHGQPLDAAICLSRGLVRYHSREPLVQSGRQLGRQDQARHKYVLSS